MQTRPTYETSADKSRERAVVDAVAARTKLTAKKLKKYSEVDFCLLKGDRVVGVAEVKVRGRDYKELFISLTKVQALRDLAAVGLAARIIFATPSGIYLQDIGPLEIMGWIGWGGRADRGDDQDQEMVVFYDMAGMRLLCDSQPEWFA